MGGSGGDKIYGGAGNDTIYGYDPGTSDNKADADTIYGGSGNDTIYGNQDDDQIWGGSGNDIIYGNTGKDILYGGLGRDTLDGGVGADTLTGGSDNDTFIFKKGEANGDIVTDFFGNGPSAADTLRFEGYGSGATFTKNAGTEFWTITHSSGTEIIKLVGVTTLDPSDYSFV
jgi:Ca2+-binding RTX toxin-like protein